MNFDCRFMLGENLANPSLFKKKRAYLLRS